MSDDYSLGDADGLKDQRNCERASEMHGQDQTDLPQYVPDLRHLRACHGTARALLRREVSGKMGLGAHGLGLPAHKR